MTTITIVDSLWRHNENCCYANMRSQGQAFVCWHLNLSVTCGTVVPRRWTCLSVILPYSTILVLVMVRWANIDPHLCCHMASPGHNVLILLAQIWKYYHIYIRDILVKKITQNFQFYIFKHWPLPVIAEQGSWRSGYLHCLCNIHQGSTMLLDGSWQKKGKIQVTNYRNILQHLTH